MFILADFGLADMYLEGEVIKRGREDEISTMEEVSKTSEIAFKKQKISGRLQKRLYCKS